MRFYYENLFNFIKKYYLLSYLIRIYFDDILDIDWIDFLNIKHNPYDILDNTRFLNNSSIKDNSQGTMENIWKIKIYYL
jgi:hypothetical protein